MTKPTDPLFISLWFIGKGLPGKTPKDITQTLPEDEFKSKVQEFLNTADDYPPVYSNNVLIGAQRVRDSYPTH